MAFIEKTQPTLVVSFLNIISGTYSFSSPPDRTRCEKATLSSCDKEPEHKPSDNVPGSDVLLLMPFLACF